MAAEQDLQYRKQRRDQWVERVAHLVDEISDWAQKEGWTVRRDRKEITEPLLGTYEVPVLAIGLPDGELQVQPIGLCIVGAEGRVDLEAFPTLNRVKLVGRGDDWEIITDSNVPLRISWEPKNFIQLARDLVA